MNELLNILIIDDNEGDRELCQRALRTVWGNNLRLREAEDGERGLEEIEKQMPIACYSIISCRELTVSKY